MNTSLLNMTDEIEQAGKEIAAQIKAARKYEAAAAEKAGTDLRKAADNWTSVYQRLAAVRAKCKDAKVSFKEFKEKYCQGLGGRSKLYKVLAIADGRTTEEQQREQDAKRQAAKRAKDEGIRDSENVTDSPPSANGQAVHTDDLGPAAQEQIANAPKIAQPEASEAASGDLLEPPSAEPAVELKSPEQSANVEVMESPQIAPVTDRNLDDWKSDLSIQMTDACSELSEQDKVELLDFLKATIDGLGLSGEALTAPLKGFQNECDKWLPSMTDDERRKARIHISEWKPKHRKAA